MGLKNLFKKNKVMGMSDFQSPGEIKKISVYIKTYQIRLKILSGLCQAENV